MNRLIHIIVNNGINLLQIIILVRVIMSWIPHNPHNQWTRLLYQVTEPILKPIRNILPGQSMGFDFSPVVVFLLLGLLKSALESVL
jgi:YggT family protein